MIRINNFSTNYKPNFRADFDFKYFRGDKTKLTEIQQEFKERTKDQDVTVEFTNVYYGNNKLRKPGNEVIYFFKQYDDDKFFHMLGVHFDKGYNFKNLFNEPKETLLDTLVTLTKIGDKGIKAEKMLLEFDKQLKSVFKEQDCNIDMCRRQVYDAVYEIRKQDLKVEADKNPTAKNIINKLSID